jgi:hypothetical protein
MVVACLALTVALSGASYAAVVLPRNSVGKAQLKKNAVVSAKIASGGVRTSDLRAAAVNSRKVRNGSLLKADFKAGQLPPSFGDGKQIGNMNDIPCNVEIVVGSQTLTVSQRARIWIHGHGSLRKSGSVADEFGLWLRLRNAANTATVAVSTSAWDATTVSGDTDAIFALASGGVLMSGENPSDDSPAYVAAPGTYILQLVVEAIGSCAANLPDFGYNQGAGMGYMLVGTG